ETPRAAASRSCAPSHGSGLTKRPLSSMCGELALGSCCGVSRIPRTIGASSRCTCGCWGAICTPRTVPPPTPAAWHRIKRRSSIATTRSRSYSRPNKKAAGIDLYPGPARSRRRRDPELTAELYFAISHDGVWPSSQAFLRKVFALARLSVPPSRSKSSATETQEIGSPQLQDHTVSSAILSPLNSLLQSAV